MFPLQWVVLVWVPLAVSQPAPPNCCATKTVGGVDYTFVREDSAAISYSCLSPCVYQRDDQPGTSFCFAQGDQQVVCGDSTEGGSGNAGGGWSDWGPWSSCSFTCGEGGTRTRERNCTTTDMGLLPSALALADVVNERAPGMVGIMLERMPSMMTTIQDRLPGMMTMFEGRLMEMMQEVQVTIMGTNPWGQIRFVVKQRKKWALLLPLLGFIEGRIPDTLGTLKEWRNNTKMSMAERIPVLMLSLSENITRVQEAIEQKLPDLMPILEEKVPRMLNIIQSKLPEILDIIDQRLPQLLAETEAALPDYLDNAEEGFSGVLEFMDGRLSPLLDILREDLLPLLENQTLNDMLPGILDVVEARMEGLLDTFDTTLLQILEVFDIKMANNLDLTFSNVGEMLGIVAENLPRILDSLERALPTLLDRVTTILPGVLSTLVEGLPGFFDSFEENLSLFVNSFRAGLLSYLEEIISTGFSRIEEMLPSALEYVAKILAGLQDSPSDLIDMIEATLPQLPGMVDERITEMLYYRQQYFESVKQALPWLLSSLQAPLDNISGSNPIFEAGGVTYPGQGQYPELGQGVSAGQGLWNFSIPNLDSFPEISENILGEISLPGESLLGLFRSVSKRQGDLPSIELGPTCPGEGEEAEKCSMATCPT